MTTVGVAREDGEAVEIDTESDFLYREGGFFDRQRALKRRRRPRPFDYDHEEDEEEIAEEHQARSEERRHDDEGGSRRRRSNADVDDQQEAEASESNHCEHHRPDGATDSSVAATKADNDNDSIAKLTAALARISQLETNLAEKTKTVDEQAANTSADVTALQQTVSMLTAQLRSVETDIHELQLAQAAASVNMAAMDESLGNRSSCSSPPASFSPAPSSVGQPIDNTAVVPPPLPDAYAANSVMGPFVSVPLSVLPPRSKLHWDLCEFAAQLQTDSDARLPAQLAAQRLCTATVQSLWPRAQVRPYGSHVTRLVLPSSDVDLVICLPKVRRDAPADAAGMLEGRNAIKETWQQNLARKLRQEPWVVPDSVKTLPHAAIPIITLLTAPPYNVRLDISFEGPGHNGLATNDVVLALLHEFPPLAPMMLVLKSFAIERGLAVAYSGGLSSYALLLLLARYLQEHSDTMPNGFANASRAVQHSLSAAQAGVADFGLMLMGFLDFYGNRFDPRTTGISVASRCFLNRESTFLAGATAASSSGMDDSPHQHQQYQQQYAADDAAVDDRTSQYGYAQHWQVPTHPYTQPPAPNTDVASTHGLRRYGYRSSLDLPTTRAANGMATGLLDYQQQLQTYDPHKFDPVFIEDPLSPSNNVGRNCFRIMQIRRAFSAAHLALLAASRDPTVFAENRMPLVAGVGLHPDNILRAILGPSAPMTTRSVTSAADHYERARKERVGSPRLVPQNHSQILSQPHQQARRSRHGATTQAQHSQPNLSQSDVQETGSGTNRKPNERSMSLSLSFADVVRDGGGSSGGAASSRAMLHKSPLALARSTRFWRDDLALEESINERWETKDDSELK
ncbi:hypothetical protein BBJ28_00006802 [Nothophytophthora sp. Chile5]|nr:hypothetical protein BBJ28_00006802 [Nothophytophthora sp. Chile5]